MSFDPRREQRAAPVSATNSVNCYSVTPNERDCCPFTIVSKVYNNFTLQFFKTTFRLLKFKLKASSVALSFWQSQLEQTEQQQPPGLCEEGRPDVDTLRGGTGSRLPAASPRDKLSPLPPASHLFQPSKRRSALGHRPGIWPAKGAETGTDTKRVPGGAGGSISPGAARAGQKRIAPAGGCAGRIGLGAGVDLEVTAGPQGHPSHRHRHLGQSLTSRTRRKQVRGQHR